MSGITDARLQLAGILEAAGVRVVFDPGLVSAPCALVVPADPWVTVERIGGARTIRFRVMAVAGRADAGATLGELEDIVGAIVGALDDPATSPGWSMPEFDVPGTLDVGGAQQLAANGRVETLTEV
jgi:hypothetical protein